MATSPARVGRSLLLLVGFGLLTIATIAGWRAIGQLSASTDRALAQTEESLDQARDIADSFDDVVARLRDTLVLVGDGLADTGTALEATAKVSQNVRSLLDLASFIGRVEDLAASLEQAETSLAQVRSALNSTAGQITDGLPAIDQAARSLRGVPERIDASLAEVRVARADLRSQRSLWRLVLVCAAGALAVVLVLAARLSSRIDRLAGTHTSGVPTPD